MVSAEADKATVFKDQTIACLTNAGGCTCTALGMVDNTSKSTEDCKGTAATMDSCNDKCCGVPTGTTCHAASKAAGGWNAICGTGFGPDYSKLTSPPGTTAAAKKTNCCRADPTATCATVTCSNRRRSNAGLYKAKAGQAAVVCESNEDCETKCCEKDATMCGAKKDDHTWRSKECGGNHTPKALETMDSSCKSIAAAAMIATFTDTATYKNACCDVKPPRATCSATPTCPTNFAPKNPMPQTKCAGSTCSLNECCAMNANVTMCSAHCKAVTVNQKDTSMMVATKSASCVTTTVTVCESTVCAATGGRRLGGHGSSMMASVIDKSKMIANGATATNATIKSTCCIPNPKPAPASNAKAKCSAYFAAAAAGAQGTVGGARSQEASLPILAVAALLSMKLCV